MILALMVQPLREALEDETKVRKITLEDAIKIQLELHKATSELADEIRRTQREDWEQE